MEEIVRVLRILEYVGERSWVEHTLANNGVKGERRCGKVNVIREASVGQYPEIVGVKLENIDGLNLVRNFVEQRQSVYSESSDNEGRLLFNAYKIVLVMINSIPGFVKEVPDEPSKD